MLRPLTRLGATLKHDFSKINVWPDLYLDEEDRALLAACGLKEVTRNSFKYESAEKQFVIAPSQYILFSIFLKEIALQASDYLTIFDEKIRPLGQSVAIAAIENEDASSTSLSALDDYSKSIFWAPFNNANARLSGKEIVNGQTLRTSRDFFTSLILKQTNLITLGSNALGNVLWILKSNMEVFGRLEKKYLHKLELIKSSKTRGDFVYGVLSFLYQYDGLVDFLAKAKPNDAEKNNLSIESNEVRLTSIFKISKSQLSEQELSSGGALRFFIDPIFLIDGCFYYLSTQWTDGTESRLDLMNFEKIITVIYSNIEFKRADGEFTFKPNSVHAAGSTVHMNLTKPFILLSGMSGTGKSRFVSKQTTSEKFCLVAVRPDWHEPSDLLGHISRIGGTKYISTKVLKFIASAWRDAFIYADENAVEVKNSNEMNPFWLCLDEMNLAPVEQYFADYLSVLETRSWDGGANSYTCEPILRISNEMTNLRTDLELDEAKFDGLWEFFTAKGIPLPPNLIVAGTVNMDETTHGFSRKVIDRALTFDFGEFFPNDFNEFFTPKSEPIKFSFPVLTHAKAEDLAAVKADPDGKKTLDFLGKVNSVLKGTPFELAYRALNELLLAVVCNSPTNNAELQAVWDDFMMMKVLPRIEGDKEKLLRHGVDDDVLTSLRAELLASFSAIQSGRPDFYRQDNKGARIEGIEVRSNRKIDWMIRRLESNGFTSFWP